MAGIWNNRKTSRIVTRGREQILAAAAELEPACLHTYMLPPSGLIFGLAAFRCGAALRCACALRARLCGSRWHPRDLMLRDHQSRPEGRSYVPTYFLGGRPTISLTDRPNPRVLLLLPGPSSRGQTRRLGPPRSLRRAEPLVCLLGTGRGPARPLPRPKNPRVRLTQSDGPTSERELVRAELLTLIEPQEISAGTRRGTASSTD
ncbi:hypothetical protein GGR56DRAFT_351108 [Xylariaceae sp. FL0804]|nr:hypothetical protein GGR56DRAFT_351108 [Xylariaceae sp. FL0804]